MNKFIQLFILTIFGFCSQVGAQQDFGLSFQIESQMENRLRELIRTYDNAAMVIVKVTLNSAQSTTLPGTNTQYSGVLGVSDIKNLAQDDIAKVHVRIISKVSPLPNSIEKLVREQLGLTNNKVTFSFEKMDNTIIQEIKTTNVADQAMEKLGDVFKLNREQLQFGFLLGFILAVTFLIAHIFNASKSRQSLEKGFQDLLSNLNKLGPSEGMERPTPRAEKSNPTANSHPMLPMSHVGQKDSLSELPTNALLALFSDCYWTKQDTYAAWLWQQITSSQRMSVLSSWKLATDYTQFLTQVPPQPDVLHHHPYYLNAFELSQVSQADLATWIQANPSSWKLISPMRQANLPVSIFQKLEWSSSDKTTSLAPTPPQTKSHPRVLSNSSALGSITEADELKIFENPKAVPQNLKNKVPTLAWVALEPLETRKTILAGFSASELAQAWVGHDVILKKLQEALPETKFKLLEGYRKNTTPSRNSEIYAALVNSVSQNVPTEGKMAA